MKDGIYDDDYRSPIWPLAMEETRRFFARKYAPIFTLERRRATAHPEEAMKETEEASKR